jgi:hypothetical protein
MDSKINSNFTNSKFKYLTNKRPSLMIKNLIILIVSLVFIGCAKLENKQNQPIKELRLSTEFTDAGVKVYYSLLGNLEKIEVYGQSDAWKSNAEAIAEADALSKLVKFVYGNEVSSKRRISIIGKAIEDAEDLNKSSKQTQDDLISFNDIELEKSLDLNGPDYNFSESTMRKASLLNETISETVTTITSKGRLAGVRKVKDYSQNDGKTYVAVYQWSEKDLASAVFIRKKMNKKQ